MTVPHFSFFPCIWVIPCLLSIRTRDLAVQKLLNVEKFFQVPLVYSYFSTCKHRGRLGTTNEDTQNVTTYKQPEPQCRMEKRCSVPSPLALQVSLSFQPSSESLARKPVVPIGWAFLLHFHKRLERQCGVFSSITT